MALLCHIIYPFILVFKDLILDTNTLDLALGIHSIALDTLTTLPDGVEPVIIIC